MAKIHRSMRTFVGDPHIAELGERQGLDNGRVEHVTAVPVRQLMVQQGMEKGCE